jgi:methylated-DNA-[protein]-cysteine S-methyltransferase
MYRLFFDTPMGRMCLESGQGDAITRLYFPVSLPTGGTGSGAPILLEGKRQLLAYMAGERTGFDVPVSAEGTVFQQAVWATLATIPYGQTRTYAHIAASVGAPRAARAVGGACHRNPVPIFIPCHRVVGSGGRLTGFAGGLDLKQTLLILEQRKESEP